MNEKYFEPTKNYFLLILPATNDKRADNKVFIHGVRRNTFIQISIIMGWGTSIKIKRDRNKRLKQNPNAKLEFSTWMINWNYLDRKLFLYDWLFIELQLKMQEVLEKNCCWKLFPSIWSSSISITRNLCRSLFVCVFKINFVIDINYWLKITGRGWWIQQQQNSWHEYGTRGEIGKKHPIDV